MKKVTSIFQKSCKKKSELKKLFWKKKRDKEMIENNDFIDKLICVSEKPMIENVFEDFRKKYSGTKRGFEIEFNLFKKTCKAYKLKPSEEVVKLLPAFLGEDELRMKTWRSNKFFPERATLQTWLRQARWTQEFEKNKTIQAKSQLERILLGED